MKLTSEDIQYFKNLSSTGTGTWLLDYCKRIEDHAYNSRDWQEGDTKESAARAARLVKELLVEKIKPTSKTGVHEAEYE